MEQLISAAGLSLAVVALVVALFQQQREQRKLAEELAELKKGWTLGEMRRIENDRSLIAAAENEVWLLGINSLGPLHESREDLIELLRAGGSVRVLLLDPKSRAFREREESWTIDGKRTGRLRTEYEAAVAHCRDIAVFGGERANIRMRVREQRPTFALVITDRNTPRGRLHYNVYPEEKHRRGYLGLHKAVPNAEPWVDEFARWIQRYEELWGGAREVDLSPTGTGNGMTG